MQKFLSRNNYTKNVNINKCSEPYSLTSNHKISVSCKFFLIICQLLFVAMQLAYLCAVWILSYYFPVFILYSCFLKLYINLTLREKEDINI